jgi:hypothetical protein
MKKSTRLFMGILFPFILIITVTSISKALKQGESSVKSEPKNTNHYKNVPPQIQQIPVSFTTNRQK